MKSLIILGSLVLVSLAGLGSARADKLVVNPQFLTFDYAQKAYQAPVLPRTDNGANREGMMKAMGS